MIVGGTLMAYASGYFAGLREGIEIGKDNSFKQIAKEAVDLAKRAIETSEKLQKENELLKRNKQTL